MTIYVDSSALLKRYVAEADSSVANELLGSDPVLVTSWIPAVEVRRNLARLLDDAALRAAQRQVEEDLDSFAMISCDEAVASAAAAISETLGVCSLDAIHLASAQRVLDPDILVVTFDLRQAQAARSLGLAVRGA